jgi:hypothetical protein
MGQAEAYFLFVLICPTCPQFAHLRWVPCGCGLPPTASSGNMAESAGDGAVMPLAFSRASLRSLFFSRRASSSSRLRELIVSIFANRGKEWEWSCRLRLRASTSASPVGMASASLHLLSAGGCLGWQAFQHTQR